MPHRFQESSYHNRDDRLVVSAIFQEKRPTTKLVISKNNLKISNELNMILDRLSLKLDNKHGVFNFKETQTEFFTEYI